jgi:alkylation response protein AidB-like acyl-CoA dehydrogenase
MNETLPKGLEFLLADASATEVFVPEDFSSEQKQIAETTEEFVKKEILPFLERIEGQDFDFVVEKMKACGDLGLFDVDVPEEYGGLELDKATSVLVTEKMAPAGSFSITFGGQTGIGLLPLVYYGTAEQKAKYLDGLASGEIIAAYALTEPDCGSDPLGARTTAVLSKDGRHYVLNGVKQFITNSSFADLFTVFGKIDGKHFSAFLVEKGFEGFEVGPEEKKMGLKGSSTTQLFLQDVPVPVENLLGEPGKGHKIAFNVLNVGRLKVGATALGMAKAAFGQAAVYAVERKQFGRAIGEFGAIKEKLADMVAAIFASESVVYRVAGLLDNRLATLDHSVDGYYEHYQKAIEEYAAECAIAKVFGSEVLDEVVDEVVQVHGGYGYISEYPAERFYRDSRIQRIFEGTNEINRILIPTILRRKVSGGALALKEPIGKKVIGIQTAPEELKSGLSVLVDLKNLFLILLGDSAADEDCQEVSLALADMIINIFAMESVLLRALKLFTRISGKQKELLLALVKVSTFDGVVHFQTAALRCNAYLQREGSTVSRQKEIAALSDYPVKEILGAKHLLAAEAMESGKFPF